jgi:hypothetical protein
MGLVAQLARITIAMLASIAIQAARSIRPRRPSNRVIVLNRMFVLAATALVAVGFGCGSQEASDPVATPRANSSTAPNSRTAPNRTQAPSDNIGEPAEHDEADTGDAASADEWPTSDRTAIDAIRAAEGARSDRTEADTETLAAEQAELLSELDSSDPEARAEAADWVDLEGESLERMISLLQSDPDEDVRATIVDRFGDEASPATTAALVIALRDPSSEVVLRAIEALELDAEEWLIPELKPLLSHSDPEVREAAEDAIMFLE